MVGCRTTFEKEKESNKYRWGLHKKGVGTLCYLLCNTGNNSDFSVWNSVWNGHSDSTLKQKILLLSS